MTIRINTGRTMRLGITIMTDADAVLTLAQWFSPSFPIGAFSYSHGLETAIAEGHVTDAASVQAWIDDILRHGAGRNDAILLAAGFGADASTLASHDALARAS